MAAPFILTGTTIAFVTSSFVAKLLSISPSQERPDVDTSTCSTSADNTGLPGKLVRRTADIEIEFDPEGDAPIDQAPEVITITWSDSSTDPWTCTGYMTNFSGTGALEERVTASATLVFSGAPTAGWNA